MQTIEAQDSSQMAMAGADRGGLSGRRYSPVVSYAVAALLSGLALLLTDLVFPGLAALPSPLFFAAVTVSAWLGGLGPGLLATALSALALYVVVLDPYDRESLGIGLVHLCTFCLAAVLISVLNDRRRRAEAAARDNAVRLGAIADASRAFSAAIPNLSATWETVARRAGELIGEVCVVWIRAEDGRRLLPVAVYHPDPVRRTRLRELLTEAPLEVGEGFTGRVIQTGEPMRRPVLRPDEAAAGTKPAYRRYVEDVGVHGLLIVPLRARGRAIGALFLSREAPGRPYTAADQTFLQELADRAALAVDNARLAAFYRGFFETVAEPLVAADEEMRFLEANPAAAALLGYGPEELTRLRVDEVIAHDAGWLTAEVERFRLARSWRGEVELRRKDGTTVPIEATVTPLDLPTGTVYLAAWHDLSARRALERAREEFLAATSHDLRTPLTAIRAALGLLEQSGGQELQAEQRELLANARRNVGRLGLLIDDLLTHNQLRTGTLRLEPKPLDLRDVVIDAAATIHSLLQQKEQPLELELPEPLPVEADEKRLGQALVNLLANANRHTPRGTRVAVSGRIADGEARLTVRDSGPGIPADASEAVFERFRRFSDVEGGSGLGLTIARGIVELHGGRLWAESGRGEGAAFHLALPRLACGGTE